MTRLGEGNPLVRAAYLAGGLARPACPGAATRSPAIAAHRGAAREAPENTLAAFERALALGADALEIDVCATRDGRFVLWHDADPDDAVSLVRQAGAEGYAYRPDAPGPGSPFRRPVRELDLSDLRARYRLVPAGRAAEGTGSADIETFDDLLGWIPRQGALRRVFLDLKLEPEDRGRAVELYETVRRAASAPPGDGVVFHLLNIHAEVVSALARAHESAGRPDRVRVSADFELPGARRLAPACGAPDVSLGLGERLWPGFRRELCLLVRARDGGGFGYVAAWTINGAKRLRELVRSGVDAIVTDEPSVLRGVVEGVAGGLLGHQTGPGVEVRRKSAR